MLRNAGGARSNDWRTLALLRRAVSPARDRSLCAGRRSKDVVAALERTRRTRRVLPLTRPLPPSDGSTLGVWSSSLSQNPSAGDRSTAAGSPMRLRFSSASKSERRMRTLLPASSAASVPWSIHLGSSVGFSFSTTATSAAVRYSSPLVPTPPHPTQPPRSLRPDRTAITQLSSHLLKRAPIQL